MSSIKELLDKYALKSKRYTIKNGVNIVDTDNGRFVIKKKDVGSNVDDIYRYLKSRSFKYFPEKIIDDKEYQIYEYIEGIDIPNEEKLVDITLLMTLLHNKTTYFKEVEMDYYKEKYETISEEIKYLFGFYNDLVTIIEGQVYMSPSNYLLIRNISKIFSCLNYCMEVLDKWEEIVRDKKKVRVVRLHNNIDVDHFIKTDTPYFISWEKSTVDMPIYDLYNFYKKHYLDFDFTSIFNLYESKYQLLEEERLLMFILLSLPWKLEFESNEYENTKKVSKLLDYIYKTEDLLVTCYKPKQE